MEPRPDQIPRILKLLQVIPLRALDPSADGLKVRTLVKFPHYRSPELIVHRIAQQISDTFLHVPGVIPLEAP